MLSMEELAVLDHYTYVLFKAHQLLHLINICFNTKTSALLPAWCFCVWYFYDSHNKERFFPLNSINRFAFVVEIQNVLCAVGTEILNNLDELTNIRQIRAGAGIAQ
jgi:hypothetical protein